MTEPPLKKHRPEEAGSSANGKGLSLPLPSRRQAGRDEHPCSLEVTQLDAWYRENKACFALPAAKKLMHQGQLSVMFAGGADGGIGFHVNRASEFYFQLRGTMYIPTIQHGTRKVVRIDPGHVFLLPSCVPHCSQRPEKDSLGLVIQRERSEDELSSVNFFANFETCSEMVFQRAFKGDRLKDELVPILEGYHASDGKRTGQASPTDLDARVKSDGKIDVPDPFNLSLWLASHEEELASGKPLNLFEGHPDKEFEILVAGGETSTFPASKLERWIYQIRGHATIELNGHEVSVSPGSCCVVPKGVPLVMRRADRALTMIVQQDPDGNRAHYEAMTADAGVAAAPANRHLDVRSARSLAVCRALMGRVIIAGAGPVGAAMACVFRRQGFEVDIYERYEDLREKPLNARRSINLVLARRGLRLAAFLGLRDDLLKRAIPVHGRMIHKDGEEHYQAYGHEHECNYSIDRGDLNAFWLEQAVKAGARVHFQKRLLKFDLEEGWIEFEATKAADASKVDHRRDVAVEAAGNSSVERIEGAKLLVACDGAGSVVRETLVKEGKLQQKQNFLEWGYKEVMFPAGPDGQYTMAKNALHIWPRGDHFLMGLANPDGSFTGTMYADSEGGRPDGTTLKGLPVPGEELHKCGSTPQSAGTRPTLQGTSKDLATARSFFEKHYSDVIPLIGGDEGIKRYCENPAGMLGNVRVDKYFVAGRRMHVALAGDACHAVVPFFGQGVQSGFEDCYVMGQCLQAVRQGELPATTLACIEEYSKSRVPDCWALRELAIDNMTEMGTKVGDEQFRLGKAIESRLETELAHKYRTRYALVCYSYNRYSSVLEAGKMQSQIVQELLQNSDVKKAEDLDIELAEKLIDEKLAPVFRQLNMSLDLDGKGRTPALTYRAKRLDSDPTPKSGGCPFGFGRQVSPSDSPSEHMQKTEREITESMLGMRNKCEMTYSQYLRLDKICDAQEPRMVPQNHDEMLFIVMHQTAELWFKQIEHELVEAIKLLREDFLPQVCKILARVKAIQNVLYQQWPVLATMTPDEFAGFRPALGQASGFQSAGYRAFEFLLGNKSRAMISYHTRDQDAVARLKGLLHMPSIYDEFLHYLSRLGLDIPDEVLHRDVTVPWESHPQVVEALKVVYTNKEKYLEAYDLAEKLVDIEENVSLWRYRHLMTVTRIIGDKSMGTGGSSGVGFLRQMVDHHFFPDLMAVRATLF
eukprot:TRINITY_DN39187_c0_g2_i1.p1 TRINITY_DN39187_c0_g2~~TRINITY_DN39187_c0_g2_i1.p1  ORF type:complete len:1223 (-),score=222.20 TRINITY_DN39187_c0_g2_i1:488-4111(-)